MDFTPVHHSVSGDIKQWTAVKVVVGPAGIHDYHFYNRRAITFFFSIGCIDSILWNDLRGKNWIETGMYSVNEELNKNYEFDYTIKMLMNDWN